MPEIPVGAVCILRGSSDDWRVVNTNNDGMVLKYIVMSLNTGQTRCVFNFELFEKNTSTYKEVDQFFQELTGIGIAEDLSFLDELFDGEQPPPKRFKESSTIRVEQLRSNNTEKTTDSNTKWSVKLLKGWMQENTYACDEFEALDQSTLDEVLQHFYASLQTKSGKEYSKAALIGIRAGINRWITSPPHSRPINLMKDRSFMLSNQVLTGLIKGLKREGKDVSQHKEPISNEDMEKLYQSGVFATTNPQALQNKVLFEVIAQFGRRGREGLCQLKKDSFIVKYDPKGRKYVRMAFNEADKTHHGLDSREDPKEPRMYATDTEFCPVKSFVLYMSKLNPKCDRFFQRPCKKFKGSDQEIWFDNMPVGVNKLNSLMPTLSKQAELSQRYTNHCIRASVSTNLYHKGFSNTSIMSVTGHRNVQSLTSYVRTTDDERCNLSNALTFQPSSSDVEPDHQITSRSVNGAASDASMMMKSLSQSQISNSQANICMNMTDARSGGYNRNLHIFSGDVSSSTITVNVYNANKSD